MTEPRIQYAKTEDGVNIAFSIMGEGEPLVHMPSIPWNHVELEFQVPEIRMRDERLAERRMLIRYDCRGTGLSDRSVVDFSLEAQMQDLQTVIDHLGLQKVDVWADANSGPAAIAFAVRRAERVSRLVLLHGWTRASDWAAAPELKALRGLLGKDWETYAETYSHVTFGWSAGEMSAAMAAIMQESYTPETLQAWAQVARVLDVEDLLPQVRAPTLVLHSRNVRLLERSVGSRIAAGVPNARLVVPDILIGGTSDSTDAIDEFLSEGEAAQPPAAGVFRTILFTDVEGSTALTDRLGDANARELLREHERMVREALKTHGGSEVKTMGDGFMASFGSATKALECAIAIQSAFSVRNESAEEPIKVRIGLNAGEPIAEDDDLYGTAVNLAARIAAQAQGGEILVSEAVRQIVAGKKFPFSDRGETTLRGFEDRVHIYQVSWRER